MLCNTTLRCSGLGTISVLSLCNTRSRSRRSYLTPTSFSVQTLKRIFCERLVWTRSSAGLCPVPWRSYTCTSNENIQLVICKELWSCITSVETLLTTVFAVATAQRSNSPMRPAVPTIQPVGPRNILPHRPRGSTHWSRLLWMCDTTS